MANAREELDLIVDKFAKQIVIVNGEVLNATNLTYAIGYLRRTPQVIKVDEHLQALEIIVKKDVDVEYLKTCIYSSGFIDLEEYNAYVDGDQELTREEIELVSKVVEELDKGDDTNG